MKYLDSGKQLALLSILGAALVGGGISPLTKIALHDIPPFSYTFLRFLIAGLVILPFFLKSSPRISKEVLKPVLISLLATVNVVFFAFGIRLTAATIGQTLYTTVPIVVAILSYFLLKQKISGKKIVGIFLGLTGTLIIILLPLISRDVVLQQSVLGNFLILLALTSYSYYSIVSKKLQVTYSPLFLTTVFVMTTIFALFFFAMGDYIHNPSWILHVSTSAILSTIYVGAAGTFIYYLLLQYAIKHGGPLISSFTLYLQPVATFLWAAAILGEKLTLEFTVGALLVFIGTAITTLVKK